MIILLSLHTTNTFNRWERNLEFPSKEEILRNLTKPMHKKIAIKTNIANTIAHKRTSANVLESPIENVCEHYNRFAGKNVFYPRDVQEAIQEIIKTAKIVTIAKL